jgi:3-oxoacyl-[acyl-carrier protein] reductase
MNLENKVVVITGGANGIGLEAAKLFLKAGANVAVWDLKKGGLDNISQSSKVLFCETNVADIKQCEVAFNDTMNQFGRVDILINNAGITRDATFQKMDAKQWQDVLDVNLTGVFNVTKTVVPSMIANQYGRIINTSSVVAHYGNFGQTNYAATKGALISFTKSLSKELGKNNITVNAVAPGFIETDIIKTMPEKVLDSLKSASDLKRAGTAEEVANVYLFLASSHASYITGSVINVDGGLSF